MKNVIAQIQSVNQRTILFALLIATTIFAMAVVAGGLDSIMPMAHDTFHEARHAAGIPCH